jgi:two-component system NtrC family sensor kinase
MQYSSRILIILIFNFFVFCSCYAQNEQKADSIKLFIESNQLSPTDQLEAYYWLTTYSTSPDEQFNYGKNLLQLAKKQSNESYSVKAYQLLGSAERLRGNLQEAFEYLFQAANTAMEIEELNPLLADIYTEISTCYTQNDDSENAMLFGRKTIDILRKTDRKQEFAISLMNLGYDYYVIGEYDSAMTYYNESDPIFKNIGMPIGEAYILGNRALVYWKKEEIERAKNDLFSAIQMLIPLGDQYGMADYYNQLANIYWEENDQENAIEYATKALSMAEQEGMKEQIRDASYLLFLLYEKSAQFEKALSFQSLYFEKKDSIQNFETTQKLANLRTLFEVGQKQGEVDLLLEQRKNNQIIMIAGALALLIMIALSIIIYYFYTAKSTLNKQLEEQKNKLLELNNTKDKFFSIISHDLRGPVGIIDGYINLFKRNFEQISKEELKEMLNQMGQSAESLVRLLDNLLQWALQQRGQFSHIPDNLSVRDLVKDSLELFQAMAVSKKISQKMVIPSDFDLYVDRNSASTIIRNLLYNAYKFTQENGKITISAVADHHTSMGIISISDNGVGMEKTKLESLFNLNDNLSTQGTLGETGLGLGLQLVNEFVQLNDGTIKVSSEVGKGTTFDIYLPLA